MTQVCAFCAIEESSRWCKSAVWEKGLTMCNACRSKEYRGAEDPRKQTKFKLKKKADKVVETVDNSPSPSKESLSPTLTPPPIEKSDLLATVGDLPGTIPEPSPAPEPLPEIVPEVSQPKKKPGRPRNTDGFGLAFEGNNHICTNPSCRHVGPIDDFGVRKIGIKIYKQPWCRKCRSDSAIKAKAKQALERAKYK
jgi:hypothetical protein